MNTTEETIRRRVLTSGLTFSLTCFAGCSQPSKWLNGNQQKGTVKLGGLHIYNAHKKPHKLGVRVQRGGEEGKKLVFNDSYNLPPAGKPGYDRFVKRKWPKPPANFSIKAHADGGKPKTKELNTQNKPPYCIVATVFINNSGILEIIESPPDNYPSIYCSSTTQEN